MAQNRLYADPDPNPNFHLDADPDSDPDCHQNDADLHADPTPSFTRVGKSGKQFLVTTWIIFLICVKDVMLFSILDSILQFS